MAAYLRFDEGLFLQVVLVLRDGEEDAEVVCRFDQLANHAGGLRACKWMWSFLPFCLRVPCFKMVVLGTTGWPDSLYVWIICKVFHLS